MVLATGATPFIPPAEGLKRSATITLNSLEEFEKHKAQVDDAQRFTVIGGGLISVELAFDLQTAGKDVTIMEPASYLLNSLVPPFVSLELERELRKAGVTVETAQSWETRFDTKGIIAKGFNEDDQLVGFIVTGEHTKAAFFLLKELQANSPA